MKRSNVTLIAGPTASGKSALALKIAREKQSVIINADSMQVYDVLHIITARPDEDELSQAPHYLYGHVSPTKPYSTGYWLRDVEALLARLERDRHMIFVGGTGLYFKALLGGLSPMPEVDHAVRQRVRATLTEQGVQELYRQLSHLDTKIAETLEPGDGQRIARALEVIQSTGKSLLWWQSQKGTALVDAEGSDRMVLQPNRAWLKARIDTRFDQMMALGALEEVQSLLALELDLSMSAMKAIGVMQLANYLAGEITHEEAIERSKIATRQYAKRQMTWFRNQLDGNWQKIVDLV